MKSYNETEFKSGDVGVSFDPSIFGRVILFFESLWTKSAKFCHAFTFANDERIVEATVKIVDSPKKKYENRVIRVYRLPLSEIDRVLLQIGLVSRVNKAYGFDKYPLFLLDSIVSWIKRSVLKQDKPCFWFTKTFHVSNIPVCSQLVVWAIHKYTKYRFKDEEGNEVNWTVINPDYLDDLLRLPINQAELIFEKV